MTTLAITPNFKNKTARFRGTVAAGEHVAVTVADPDGAIADATNLRLRVVGFGGRTLAQFPMPEEKPEILPSFEAPDEDETPNDPEPTPEPQEWTRDGDALSCELNLNTVQMLKAVPPAATVSLLFVLDAYEAKTLYFKEMFAVEHWPRKRGKEDPVNLDDYQDIIAEFREDIYGEGGFKDRVESAEASAATSSEAAVAAAERAYGSQTSAANSAAAAQGYKSDAQTAASRAEAWATGGSGGTPSATNNAKNYSEVAREAVNAAQTARDEAEAAKEAAEAALPLSTRLTEAGKAAEAKAVGDALALKADNTELARKTNNIESALDDEIENRKASCGDLERNKADKSTTYTKTEVDAKIAEATPGDYDELKERVASNTQAIASVNSKIPAQASPQNQLADKNFVNSSVATNTANYISDDGEPFTSLADLEAYSGPLTNNDYAFVVGTDAAGNTTYTRYKYNANEGEWAEEYVLNNSSFTAAQWAAISSGITSGLVAKLDALPTAEALAAALAGKQAALTAQQLANIAAVPDKRDLTDRSWSELRIKPECLPITNGTDVTQSYDWSSHSVVESVLTPGKYELLDANGVSAAVINPDGTVFGGDRILFNGEALYRGFQVAEFTAGTLALSSEVTAAVAAEQTRATAAEQALATNLNNKASRAANPTAGNLAALDANGNPTNSGVTAGELARYSLYEPPHDSAIQFRDRAVNTVEWDIGGTMYVVFPALQSGRVRDFILRLVVATGTSAPSLMFTSELTFEAPDGEMPDLSEIDGGGTMLIYFSEVVANRFYIKSEIVEEVAQ